MTSHSERRTGNSGQKDTRDLDEEDAHLARIERRATVEDRLVDIERKSADMGLGPIDGGSNKPAREKEGSLDPKIPKGIIPKYVEGDDG